MMSAEINTGNGARALSARRFYARQTASPIAGVSMDAWGRFAKAMEVQSNTAVSASGGLGTYDIRPRRLVELGLCANLRLVNKHKERSVYECDFKLPWTKDRFLGDLMAQCRVFAQSMALYRKDLADKVITQPDGVSLAGALAILHVGGQGALRAWPDLFENTRARYESAQGAF